MFTSRDVQILGALHRYHVLTREQIQWVLFTPGRTGARNTRRRLQALKADGLIVRHSVGLLPDDGGATPVYHLSQTGREYLARVHSDLAYLKTNRHAPRGDRLLHWLALSQTHVIFDKAVARPDEEIRVVRWINEYDFADTSAAKLEQRFALYTLIAEKPNRLTCQPDAGFLLTLGEHNRVFFLEQDRGTMWPNQFGAGKTPGYAAMAERQLHRTIFKETTSDKFFVLVVTTDARRRDALREIVSTKPRADLWKFTVASQLTPDTIFDGQIFYRCEGEAERLINRPSPPKTQG